MFADHVESQAEKTMAVAFTSFWCDIAHPTERLPPPVQFLVQFHYGLGSALGSWVG